jgi:hypothetical protein
MYVRAHSVFLVHVKYAATLYYSYRRFFFFHRIRERAIGHVRFLRVSSNFIDGSFSEVENRG